METTVVTNYKLTTRVVFQRMNWPDQTLPVPCENSDPVKQQTLNKPESIYK